MQASYRTLGMGKGVINLANFLGKTSLLQLVGAKKTSEKTARILAWLALDDFQPLQRRINTLESIHDRSTHTGFILHDLRQGIGVHILPIMPCRMP